MPAILPVLRYFGVAISGQPLRLEGYFCSIPFGLLDKPLVLKLLGLKTLPLGGPCLCPSAFLLHLLFLVGFAGGTMPSLRFGVNGRFYGFGGFIQPAAIC